MVSPEGNLDEIITRPLDNDPQRVRGRRMGNTVWTASEAFFDVEWIHLFWIFFAILFIGGLGTMGAEPWPMLGIDPMLVGLAIVQATTNGLVLAVITIVVASLLHIQTN
jgi:hypothetical protein